jgi:SAM-dependent methyltransferase
MNPIHNYYCGSKRYESVFRERLLPAVTAGVELGGDVLEVGPGFGAATEWLSERARTVTALEYDEKLARRVSARVPLARVVNGSGANIPLDDASYDVVLCTTMLHHVPTVAEQNALLAEVRRVLRPGGVFCGSDSRSGPLFRLAHVGDVMNVVDPFSFDERLESIGFDGTKVTVADRAFLFRATR